MAYDEAERLQIKCHADQLSLQKVMETCAREYLRDNRHIMKMLAPLERTKRLKARRGLSEQEARKLLEELERESPLQDIVIPDKLP